MGVVVASVRRTEGRGFVSEKREGFTGNDTKKEGFRNSKTHERDDVQSLDRK